MKTNDGGPAFPCDWKDYQPGTGLQVSREQYQGLTMRDWFAGMALQANMIRAKDLSFADTNHFVVSQSLANAAYLIADAMLAERTK